MENDIVYFQCNDWEPTPVESERFINEILENKEFKTPNEYFNKMKENRLCVNVDAYDMSGNYWITCSKSWIHENYPELDKIVSDEPYDLIYEGDRKYFLKYIEMNFGYFMINEKDYEQNKEIMVKYIKSEQ